MQTKEDETEKIRKGPRETRSKKKIGTGKDPDLFECADVIGAIATHEGDAAAGLVGGDDAFLLPRGGAREHRHTRDQGAELLLPLTNQSHIMHI